MSVASVMFALYTTVAIFKMLAFVGASFSTSEMTGWSSMVNQYGSTYSVGGMALATT